MPVGPGFGLGHWGSMPWGSAELLPDVTCDLFGFDSCSSMPSILADPAIAAIGDPSQFSPGYPPPGTNCDLGLLSGDTTNPSFPQTGAYLTATPSGGVPSEYTLELTIGFEELPNDFTNISANHLMFSVAGPTGPCVLFLLSKAGIAYAGNGHFTPAAPAVGTLVLDTSLLQIPDTAPIVTLNNYLTIRVSVSSPAQAVYLYATPADQVDISGHHLVAVLPIFDAADLPAPPTLNQAIISVVGSSAQPTRVALDRWCLASQFVIPNIAPVANAGKDQAARLCSIVQLNAESSFDPEGAPLFYDWRLIDGPVNSEFVEEGYDGVTHPEAVPTGLTDKFYSAKLAVVESTDPILAGDVLLVGAVPDTVIAKGSDINGFFVRVAVGSLNDSLSAKAFKLLRARALSDRAAVKPTFFPDVSGFYKFDLTVFDGSIFSAPAVVVVNVVDSPLPRGCLPSTAFLFNYFSDFWGLVEDSNRIATVWDAVAQVTATELYTLWQHEYSKSLRDIQRTFIRRWLHYDLLLPEPIPELTNLRLFWSGVDSQPILNSGDGSINSSVLVVSSPLFGTATIGFGNSTLPANFARELQNRLQELDGRFLVTVIPARDGTHSVLRITAPFAFAVSPATTVTAFASSGSNGVLSGTGSTVGTRTYVVDRSLLGLDVQEDDLLVVTGIGYRIIRVVDGELASTDGFNFQRLALKDELPADPSLTGQWSISSTVKSQLLDFYHGLVSAGDDVFLEVISADSLELKSVKALGVSSALVDVLSLDFTNIRDDLSDPTKTVRLAKVVRRTYVPLSSLVVEIPILQAELQITDVEAVLRLNLDYFIEQFRGTQSIRFLSDAGMDGDVWEGLTPPDRLWAEYTYIDNSEVIEANFGAAANLPADKLTAASPDIDYLSAVRGLWYAFFKGPKPYNLRVGAQIFLGLPFAEEAGTIEEIRTDFSSSFGRILIRDTANTEIVRSYRFPSFLALEVNTATGVPYVVGDLVTQFAPLVKGVEYVDWVKDSQWFTGLSAQGVMSEAQKYHTFSITIDSRVFSLNALSLVRDFILQAKATYDYPLFIVQFVVDQIDIDITDTLTQNISLLLHDSTCSTGGAPIFDDPRPGGSGATPPTSWWNSFDQDDNDATPPPTFPVSDGGITWGYDRELLCPSDVIDVFITRTLGAPTPAAYDMGILQFDTPTITYMLFSPSSPFTIPAVPGAYTPGSTQNPGTNGTLTGVRFRAFGSLGAVPTDFEFVVTVNGADAFVHPFTAAVFNSAFVVDISPPVAVVTTDTVSFKVRIPLGSGSPGARITSWTSFTVYILDSNGAWSFDGTLPAGAYANTVHLT